VFFEAGYIFDSKKRPVLLYGAFYYLSYPIKQGESGIMTNKCKVEATGNKIDIKPNEEITLSVYIPSEDYENNKIDSNRPQYEIEGYINVVSNLTHFGQSGDIAK
jgi:biotin synthase-related radical SAM superfamily protein